MSAQHTPTPYIANEIDDTALSVIKDATNYDICEARTEDAAFIVRACNSHDALVAALREAEALIPELVRQCPNGAPMSVAAAHDRIRAALAAAEVQS